MKTPDSTSSPLAIVAGRIQARINRFQERHHVGRVAETIKRANDLQTLSDHLGIPDHALSAIRNEYGEVMGELEDDLGFHATSDPSLLWVQYLICRFLKPALVVETGVWIGSSSFAILEALRKNETGRLVSIDFPPLRKKHRVDIGRVVREDQYPLWSLHLGPSKSLLGKVAEAGTVDIFIHDSDHTYLNMMAEFRKGWSLLRPGGVLVSDDSSLNDSLLDFSDGIGIEAQFFQREKGGTIALMKKPAS